MASNRTTINSLPSELLLQILQPLPTPQLFPVSLLSRRFNALVAHLVQARFTHASTLPGHHLVFECYLPSAQFSTPSLDCTYSHTPRLDDGEDLTLSQLNQLYSSFRLSWKLEMEQRYPVITISAPSPPEFGSAFTGDLVYQDVHLDDGESFAQLCAKTILLRDGPHPGLYAGSAEVGDGVIRVWREWLAQRAAQDAGKGALPDVDGGILWADLGRTVGVKVSVAESERPPAGPVLVSAEEELEEPPVSYRLVYEEVLVRTRQVVKALEKSAAEKPPDSGTEIMILP